MKKAFLFLLFLAACGSAFAQLEEATTEKEVIEKAVCHYVYLDRQSPVTNTVKGQNEKGDVIDVIPCADITPPKWDFKNFDIIKMSLTPTEAAELKEPLLSNDETERKNGVFAKERKNKIDVSTLQKATPSSLGDVLYEKSEITKNITVKSTALSVSK